MISKAIRAAVILIVTTALFGQSANNTDGRAATIVGYLRDAGCVHRFHEVVKPLPNGCLEACVRGGSPLVVLTKSEEVYHPISPAIPDRDIRSKLLPYAGKLVRISGNVYARGGSKAITVEQIAVEKD